MNYREARKIADGPNAGKWHYTNKWDGEIRADGACREDCPGHDTPEEAYEHERLRIVAEAEIIPLAPDEAAYSPGRCEAACCTEPTTHWVRLPYPESIASFRLCDEHATPEEVDALVTVGPSVSSW